MNVPVRSYRDLLVWKAAIEIAVDCYSTTKTFPNNEMYGMTSQLRRSSASIAANIAEGYGRELRGSFIQFLRIAQGSLKELETHVVLCGRVGLMVENDVARLLGLADDLGKNAAFDDPQFAAKALMMTQPYYSYSLLTTHYSLLRRGAA